MTSQCPDRFIYDVIALGSLPDMESESGIDNTTKQDNSSTSKMVIEVVLVFC